MLYRILSHVCCLWKQKTVKRKQPPCWHRRNVSDNPAFHATAKQRPYIVDDQTLDEICPAFSDRESFDTVSLRRVPRMVLRQYTPKSSKTPKKPSLGPIWHTWPTRLPCSHPRRRPRWCRTTLSLTVYCIANICPVTYEKGARSTISTCTCGTTRMSLSCLVGER